MLEKTFTLLLIIIKLLNQGITLFAVKDYFISQPKGGGRFNIIPQPNKRGSKQALSFWTEHHKREIARVMPKIYRLTSKYLRVSDVKVAFTLMNTFCIGETAGQRSSGWANTNSTHKLGGLIQVLPMRMKSSPQLAANLRTRICVNIIILCWRKLSHAT